MDWLVLLWTIFVCVVYIGGYFAPASIGSITSNLTAVYAIVFIIGVAACALRYRSAASSLEQETPPGKERGHSA